MAVSFTYSNRYKYALMKKLLDISADSIKVLLMRSGFVFNKDTHATLLNIKADTTAAQTIGVTSSTKTFTGAGGIFAAGGFLTKGFVPGNKIVVTGLVAANGTYTVATVPGETTLTVVEAIGGGADVAGTGDEQIVAEDELATGGGYTKDTKTTGTITMAAEDDTNDRCDATFPDVVWTAVGTNIGPTPGALLYDDTSAENTIIGYFDFDGAVTTVPPDTLTIANGVLRTA